MLELCRFKASSRQTQIVTFWNRAAPESMKPSLQLKISQQLTMTPQLQQAIRLLQLSTLDLQQEIQENLEANPMLEAVDDFSQDDIEIPSQNSQKT